MESGEQREKWARWPPEKVELFVKIVVTFWTDKLKRDVQRYLYGSKLPLVHLEHRRVKKSASLLGVASSDSKSLQIKYVRIVNSFSKKQELPRALMEAIEICEQYPQINFLLGRIFVSQRYAPVLERFTKLVAEITQLIVSRRPERPREAPPVYASPAREDKSEGLLMSTDTVSIHSKKLARPPAETPVDPWPSTDLSNRVSLNTSVPGEESQPDHPRRLARGRDSFLSETPLISTPAQISIPTSLLPDPRNAPVFDSPHLIVSSVVHKNPESRLKPHSICRMKFQ